MKININNDYYIKCEVYNNSRHWGHRATLYNKYHNKIDKLCYTYYNRTWERYQFESVLAGFAWKLDKQHKDIIPLKDRILFYNKVKDVNNLYGF